MSEKYQRVQQNWEEQMGVGRAGDLFENWTPNTTAIYHEYPISPGRFVTANFEGYSLMAFGLEALITISVWENQQLVQQAYVEVQDVIAAKNGDFFRLLSEKNYMWAKGKAVDAGYVFSLHRYIGDGEYLNESSVTLTYEELSFLYERVKPMSTFKRLPEA